MEERILVLAPRGRDAQVIAQVLTRAAIQAEAVGDVAKMHAALHEGAAGLLMTEEALAGPDLAQLLAWFEGQAPWSDMPVVLLATRQAGQRSKPATALLEQLGNVVVLERPVNSQTLVSAARSAIRARRRHYKARALLQERDDNERALRELNGSLEARVLERTRALDRTHETLAFALQSAEFGSWDLDLKCDTSRHTLQHDLIFGYPDAQEAWGTRHFLSHVLEEERSEVEAAFQRAEQSGLLDMECRIRRRDGAIRNIRAKGRVSYDASGDPARMAGVVMDNTERRQTETALRQAQKMEAIGQLTGGVAHDFNNLLTVVVGALELMTRTPSNPDRVARLATAAMTAARRGEQLTQQLLVFSRRQMLRPQTLDPNRLLMEVEALAQRAVGEAVTLRLDLAHEIAPVLIDPAQFESAVLNLVVNARDAMPNGGDIILASRNVPAGAHATHDLRLPDGPYVCISVTDSGSGIDAPTLARVFEPFFTTKEVGRGSGLGLSQVYGFTRSAGGDVAIHSTPGRGTTLRLYFPHSTEKLAEEEAPPPSQPRRGGSGETVLLVEDDEQVRAMAVESLRELDYHVIVACDAQEALHHLSNPARIDVMFSDVVMPGGMNGTQLAAAARRMRPDLKVLLTSGYVGERAGQRPVDDEFDLLTKPYRREDLAEKLRGVLAR